MSQPDPPDVNAADGNITGKIFDRWNTAGNKRQLRVLFTTTSTSCDVVCPFTHIDSFEVECSDPTASGVDRQVTGFMNSNTTSDDVKGFGGQMHLAAITSGLQYTLTVRGT